MTSVRILILSSLSMLAFACNSLLCRVALTQTGIDAASFASTRLISGAAVLWLIVRLRRGPQAKGGGDWWSAGALFAYAATFSYAYVSLSTATGALLLFGAVQASMIGYGLWAGERLRRLQLVGLALAIGGLAGLLSPGLSAPPVAGAVLMISAGVAWGVYSLRGRGAGDPLASTAGNFLRTVPLCLALSVATLGSAQRDGAGLLYGIASGAVASGLGYIIWYAALPALKATSAAIMQLSVPVLAALGGVALLNEPLTLRFALSAAAILGGIALVVVQKKAAAAAASGK